MDVCSGVTQKYLSQEYYCPEILTFASHEEKREGERGREREREREKKMKNCKMGRNKERILTFDGTL